MLLELSQQIPYRENGLIKTKDNPEYCLYKANRHMPAVFYNLLIEAAFLSQYGDKG